MIARIARTAAAFLVFAAIATGGLVLWSGFLARQYDEAVAEAEDWNRAYWETGSALKITARMTYRYLGEDAESETALLCFQKRMVGRGNDSGPTSYTVSEAVGLKSLFAVHAENRSVYVGPSGGLCAGLFRDGPPAGLPTRFSGDVVITEIPDDEASDVARLTARLGPACRLTWETGRPLDLDGVLQIDRVEMTSVEEVPMSSALSKPEHMGSADATLARLVRAHSGGGDVNQPARFQWDEAKKCWIGAIGAGCATEMDDVCGIPRL